MWRTLNKRVTRQTERKNRVPAIVGIPDEKVTYSRVRIIVEEASIRRDGIVADNLNRPADFVRDIADLKESRGPDS